MSKISSCQASREKRRRWPSRCSRAATMGALSVSHPAARVFRAPPRAGCPRVWSDRAGSCRTAPCTDRSCAACAPGSAPRRTAGARSAGRAHVDLDETPRRIAGLIGRDRRNAVRRLVDVPDALVDEVPTCGTCGGRRRSERQRRRAAPNRARTARRPIKAPCPIDLFDRSVGGMLRRWSAIFPTSKERRRGAAQSSTPAVRRLASLKCSENSAPGPGGASPRRPGGRSSRA